MRRKIAKRKKTRKVREKFDFGILYQKEAGGLCFFRYQLNYSRKSLRKSDIAKIPL